MTLREAASAPSCHMTSWGLGFCSSGSLDRNREWNAHRYRRCCPHWWCHPAVPVAAHSIRFSSPSRIHLSTLSREPGTLSLTKKLPFPTPFPTPKFPLPACICLRSRWPRKQCGKPVDMDMSSPLLLPTFETPRPLKLPFAMPFTKPMLLLPLPETRKQIF